MIHVGTSRLYILFLLKQMTYRRREKKKKKRERKQAGKGGVVSQMNN